MHVQRHVDIDGYRFSISTLDPVIDVASGDGHPVVDVANGDRHPVIDVASGEVNLTTVLATYLLDTRFHPSITQFSGTSGAQNAAVHAGDVVVSGFAVDRSAIHDYLGG
jgi:hypothetical protein